MDPNQTRRIAERLDRIGDALDRIAELLATLAARQNDKNDN